MKDDFNHRADETPERRLETLKEKGQAIDKWLRTPQRPQQQLTPRGNIRQQANDHARQQMSNQRIDIAKEVKAIEQRMAAKQQEKENTNERDRKRSLGRSR